MSDAPAAAVPIAQAVAIDADIPCFCCGYSLRTLEPGGACPECGSRIERSFLGGWLLFADRAWLAKLRKGVSIILWMLLASVAAYALFVAVMIATMTVADEPDMFSVGVMAVLFGLGFYGVWLWTIWLLTCPEPPRRGCTERFSLGWWIRTLNVAAIPLSMLYVLLFVAASGSDPARIGKMWPLFFLSSIGGMAFWAAFVLLLVHMRRLARRDLSKGLAKLMSVLLWSVIVMIAVLSVSIPSLVLSTVRSAAAGGPFVAATTTQSTTMPVFVVGPPVGGSATATPFATSQSPVATSAPATLPGRPGLPFGRYFFLFVFLICGSEAAMFAWFVAGVVALFWFRRVFTRAIQSNAASIFAPTAPAIGLARLAAPPIPPPLASPDP